MARRPRPPPTGRGPARPSCPERSPSWLWSGNVSSVAGGITFRLLAFVMEAAAGGFGAAAVDRGLAFLDVLDLAFFIDDKCRAVGDAQILNEHAVILRHFTL